MKCPLLKVEYTEEIDKVHITKWCECLKDDCAWYYTRQRYENGKPTGREEKCAILKIAESLNKLIL